MMIEQKPPFAGEQTPVVGRSTEVFYKARPGIDPNASNPLSSWNLQNPKIDASNRPVKAELGVDPSIPNTSAGWHWSATRKDDNNPCGKITRLCMTYNDAKRVAEEVGLRLPTIEEIGGKAPKGPGADL